MSPGSLCWTIFALWPSRQLHGLSGAQRLGKTTLVHLIPRFYDPTSGRILIDGLDLRDVTLSSLRNNIGMVMQETFLFRAHCGKI